jgi:hypothetical protein
MTKITEVRCIRTRANGSWTIVKVLTDQPGLYGIGSASDFRQSETVIKAVETIAPAVMELGDEVVPWDKRQLVDAIKRQARHEETTRFDMIEFKLD